MPRIVMWILCLAKLAILCGCQRGEIGAEEVNCSPAGHWLAQEQRRGGDCVSGLAQETSAPRLTSRGEFMSEIDSVGTLDEMECFSERGRDELRSSLRDVADLRLEEAPERRSRPLFYLQASWLNLREIVTAVRQARPWLFPLRLGCLSAAAISVLFVLMVTAEVWELGMSQPAARVGALTAAVFVATTVYIIKRQRLLVRPGSRASPSRWW